MKLLLSGNTTYRVSNNVLSAMAVDSKAEESAHAGQKWIQVLAPEAEEIGNAPADLLTI